MTTSTSGDVWDCFIGQEQVKRQLRIAANSAKRRGEPMSHVLLASGEPGIGKTTLAHLITYELGTSFKELSGKIGPNEARIALSDLRDHDVLFIDEVHRIGQAGFDWMLHLLSDGVLIGPLGAEMQPAITVIAATTDMGKLPRPLINRFPLQPYLTDYDDEEGAEIARVTAGDVFTYEMEPPDEDDCRVIARAANNNPRTIRSILENLRDVWITDPTIYEPDTGCYSLAEAIEWLGLSVDGLTMKAREYLRVLYTDFAGQAGEKALASRLNEPGGLGHLEAVLIKRGYVTRQSRGRVLTRDGIHRAKQEIDHG